MATLHVVFTKRISYYTYSAYKVEEPDDEITLVLRYDKPPMLDLLSYIYDVQTQRIYHPYPVPWTKKLHDHYYPKLTYKTCEYNELAFPVAHYKPLPTIIEHWYTFASDSLLQKLAPFRKTSLILSYVQEKKWTAMVRELGGVDPMVLFCYTKESAPLLEARILQQLTLACKASRKCWMDVSCYVHLLIPTYLRTIQNLLDAHVIIKHDETGKLALAWAAKQHDQFMARLKRFTAQYAIETEFIHQLSKDPVLALSCSLPSNTTPPFPSSPYVFAYDTTRALDVWIDAQKLPITFLDVDWKGAGETAEQDLLSSTNVFRFDCTSYTDGMDKWCMYQKQHSFPTYETMTRTLVISEEGTYSARLLPDTFLVQWTQNFQKMFTKNQLCFVKKTPTRDEYSVLPSRENPKGQPQYMSIETIHNYTCRANSCSFAESIHKRPNVAYDEIIVVLEPYTSIRFIREAKRIGSEHTKLVLLHVKSK
jgi:hypothetical protein